MNENKIMTGSKLIEGLISGKPTIFEKIKEFLKVLILITMLELIFIMSINVFFNNILITISFYISFTTFLMMYYYESK